MSKLFFYDDEAQKVIVPVAVRQRKKYGFFSFLFDIVMVLITWGLWLIWIFVREMRRR
jgi:hypothetical protein